jgi:hypothetical protein
MISMRYHHDQTSTYDSSRNIPQTSYSLDLDYDCSRLRSSDHFQSAGGSGLDRRGQLAKLRHTVSDSHTEPSSVATYRFRYKKLVFDQPPADDCILGRQGTKCINSGNTV